MASFHASRGWVVALTTLVTLMPVQGLASLVGDTVTVSRHRSGDIESTSTVVVTDGPSDTVTIQLGNRSSNPITFDLEESGVSIVFDPNGTNAGHEVTADDSSVYFDLGDLDWLGDPGRRLSNVTIEENTVAGLSISKIGFSNDVVRIDEAHTSWRTGDSLKLEFHFEADSQSAFTYRGKLSVSEVAANGIFQFEFRLFDQPSTGTQIAPTILRTEVEVLDGQFETTLDFGEAVFASGARWLEVRVRPDLPSPFQSRYHFLAPRLETDGQPEEGILTGGPYSLESGASGQAEGARTGADGWTLYGAQ